VGLFSGIARFAPKCRSCGLDFSQFNVGDGPAAFLILIVGAFIMIGAVVTELKFAPPLWVHALLWLPLTGILVIALLRIAKGLLLIQEYRTQAKEGGKAE
jgi:uncharacterized protein (DUF983 family)